MNKDILKGNWKQLKGEAQRKWGELTDDELDKIEGDAMKLSGLIQKHYGKTREQAEKEVSDWRRTSNV